VIDYLPIGLQLLAASGLAFVLLGLSSLSGHRSGSSTDLSAYECGVDLFEPAEKRYTIRFYMVAVLFILFDIEAAFLYPWATAFRRLGIEGFIVMLVFLVVLTVGLVYCWRRGALDWD
jgi:NADH-quinone oxidoreductase subunit A